MEVDQEATNIKTSFRSIIVNNSKITYSVEKEKAFRPIWAVIFSITPEENARYEINNEIQVLNNNEAS